MTLEDLSDLVIKAIAECLDYDLGKSLDPELSEDPDEIPDILARARIVGYAKYLDIKEEMKVEEDAQANP